MGLTESHDLRPWHLMRRVSPTEVRHYGELYRYLHNGELLGEDPPVEYANALHAASAQTFSHQREAMADAISAPHPVSSADSVGV